MRDGSQLCDIKAKIKMQFGNFRQNKHVTESSMHWTLLCCSEAFHNSKSLRNERLSFKLSKYIMIISMTDKFYRCIVIV